MDDFNNAYGRQCGQAGTDKKSCEESCINAVNDNILKSHKKGTDKYSKRIGFEDGVLESIYGGSNW